MGLIGKLRNEPEYYSYYTRSAVNTSTAKIKPHLKASFVIMQRYRGKYPGYALAYIVNALQYAYAFLPAPVRGLVHESLARLKRFVAG